MATQNLLDEKHITNALVYIDGEEIKIVSLTLQQEFGKQHTFCVKFDSDRLCASFLGSPAEQFALIGKQIDINLQQGDLSGVAYQFRGVIRTVYHQTASGKHGNLVVLEGSDMTALLNRGKRLDVFSDMTLAEVVEEVTAGVQNNSLSTISSPRYNAPIRFLMQYYESDWEFLQRLAAITGEPLFYTGMDLVFGEYKDWEPIDVTYDKEMLTLKFGTRLVANTFSQYEYLPQKDELLQQESPATVENSNEYIDVATKQAATLIKDRPPLLPSSLPVDDKGSLDDLVNQRKSTTAAETLFVEGTTRTCEPRIGRIINILMPTTLPGARDLGSFRIISVKHKIEENHDYKCEFTAVPAELKFVPAPAVNPPVAGPMLATVIKNDDPESLGRVKVEFPFAQDRVCEAWLRVMTPDGGGLAGYGNKKTGVVEKNRGMVFIPEEGDQVMVGFELGDPNRPYVMGSLFHGGNGKGGDAENHIKSITTRSGHTIEFDDAQDTLGITIKDNNGNIIHLDSKEKNIEITAPETITLKATDIRMQAANNIELQAEGAIHADAMAEIHIGAQADIDIATETGMQIKSMGATTITAKAGMEIEGQSASLKSSSSTEVSGIDTAVKGQTTKVSGSAHAIEIV